MNSDDLDWSSPEAFERSIENALSPTPDEWVWNGHSWPNNWNDWQDLLDAEHDADWISSDEMRALEAFNEWRRRCHDVP